MSDPAPILDELRAMAVFATVVRSGSFAAAARSLGLTRAVVSHHIRALEVKLGVPLAQRSTRSFSLTPAGEAFRVHCERLLDEANDGIRGMELLRAEPAVATVNSFNGGNSSQNTGRMFINLKPANQRTVAGRP